MEDLVSTFRWDLLWKAMTKRIYTEMIRPYILLNGNIDEWIGRIAAIAAMTIAFRTVKNFQTALAIGTISGAVASFIVYCRRRWKRKLIQESNIQPNVMNTHQDR